MHRYAGEKLFGCDWDGTGALPRAAIRIRWQNGGYKRAPGNLRSFGDGNIDRLGLWKALRSRGVPNVLLDLIVALHHGTGVQVRQGQNLSECLLTTSGVRQGCVLAPALFCVAIDWILRHMKDKPGIDVGREHFSDLVYADDTAFLINTASDTVSSLSSFQDTASALGLRISWPKTKLQNLGAGHKPPPVSVDGNAVDSVDSFIYLGSLLSSDGYCRPDINRRSLISYVCSTRHLEGPISVH